MVVQVKKRKKTSYISNNAVVLEQRLLGPFKVGDNVKIAANAVVLNEIPPNCTAVRCSCRIVKRDGMRLQPIWIRLYTGPCITGDMQVKTNDRAS